MLEIKSRHLTWVGPKRVHRDHMTLMSFYPNAPKISLLKQGLAPFTMLQNIYFKTFSEYFTCKLFSKSILSSQKWNPIKNSTDSWFRANSRECFCSLKWDMCSERLKINYVSYKSWRYSPPKKGLVSEFTL